HHASPRK
nr:Chain E, SUBSTRATE PEPTIDE [synthetic construct]1GY3_F Chain F, SUBSTRATE PEPTIDE [synthetic construct]1QMZ_E Chain E, Substrate Peptide [Homo sapiens]1QMZ_F Chain F, Substrate Peptide [Homo sapiens]